MEKLAEVLVVANRTAATPALLEAVRERANAGPASFHLLVPASPPGLHRLADPEDHGREEAEANLREALPAVTAAARAPVTGHVGDPNPVAAIEDALHTGSYEEAIISTLPSRASRWMRLDLPTRARQMGLSVTHVEPEAVDACQLPAVALAG